MSGGLKLLVRRVAEDAKLPIKATNAAAAYDLYSLEAGIIPAGEKAAVRTGIAIRMPSLDYPYQVYGSIRSRSGLSYKNGIEVGAGVIDLDYQDEVLVILYNHSKYDFNYEKHSRVAQLILEVTIAPSIAEVAEFTQLKNNNRVSGFGSTGMH